MMAKLKININLKFYLTNFYKLNLFLWVWWNQSLPAGSSEKNLKKWCIFESFFMMFGDRKNNVVVFEDLPLTKALRRVHAIIKKIYRYRSSGGSLSSSCAVLAWIKAVRLLSCSQRIVSLHCQHICGGINWHQNHPLNFLHSLMIINDKHFDGLPIFN